MSETRKWFTADAHFGSSDILSRGMRPFRDAAEYTRSVGGAETFDELFARTGEFLKEVIDPLMIQGKNVLIVGHGAMNLSIIGRIRGIPISGFWSPGIENCRMIRLI